MSSAPSPRRFVAFVVAAFAAGVLAAVLSAADAQAFNHGQQRTQGPGARMNVDFPGRRYDIGDRIPKGHAVVRRTVTISRAEGRRATSLRCPAGTYAYSPGAPDPVKVGFSVDDSSQYRKRVRLFRFRVYAFPDAVGSVRGTVYLLCRPR